MKLRLAILFITFVSVIQSQSVDYNLKKGYVAEGYDVVAYFFIKKLLKAKKILPPHLMESIINLYPKLI